MGWELSWEPGLLLAFQASWVTLDGPRLSQKCGWPHYFRYYHLFYNRQAYTLMQAVLGLPRWCLLPEPIIFPSPKHSCASIPLLFPALGLNRHFLTYHFNFLFLLTYVVTITSVLYFLHMDSRHSLSHPFSSAWRTHFSISYRLGLQIISCVSVCLSVTILILPLYFNCFIEM